MCHCYPRKFLILYLYFQFVQLFYDENCSKYYWHADRRGSTEAWEVRWVKGNFYNLNIRWSFFSFSRSILLNVTNLDYMEVGVDIKQRNKGHPKLTESNMKIYTSVVYILLVVQMYLSGPITYNQRNPFYYSKNHRPWPRIWGLLLFDIIINIFPPK